MLQLNQHIEIDLTDFTPNGDCMGKYEGQVVFVPLGLPGEKVIVEIVHVKRSWARGRIVQWLVSDPNRVPAPCAYFGSCGGCQLQHLRYEAQLHLKTQAVKEHFLHIGKFADPPILPCIACTQEYYYRNHIQFTVSKDGTMGYHAPRQHSVIAINECMIADPALNQAITDRKNGSAPQPSYIVTPIGNSIDLRVPMTPIRVAEYDYYVSAGSFFQVNTHMAGALVRTAIDGLDLQPSDKCLDLFCGVGLFTLPMIKKCDVVVGIEMSDNSTADARRNLRQYMLQERVRIMTADVGKALKRTDIRHQKWDKALLDPPRAGVQYETLMALIEIRPRKIVYVSCDPATLARDAKHLSDRGYRLISAQPIDMFPQTHHVETVAVFET
jgi:23S rRNA (uracil1939-C5)-methyltransferase